MRSFIRSKIFILLSALSSFGCLCFEHPIQEDYEHSDAVFWGIIKEINEQTRIFPFFESSSPARYFNLKVIQYVKGLGPGCRYISLFEEGFTGSCSGLLHGYHIDDTVVVFANKMVAGELTEYSEGFLCSSKCTNNQSFKKYKPEELAFVRALPWKPVSTDQPEYMHSDVESTQPPSKNPLLVLLLISVGLNVLGFFMWISRKEGTLRLRNKK